MFAWITTPSTLAPNIPFGVLCGVGVVFVALWLWPITKPNGDVCSKELAKLYAIMESESTPNIKVLFYLARDGSRLAYTERLEENEPEKKIIILHGSSSFSEYYALLGNRLLSRGVHVLCLDLRGHGKSSHAECTYPDQLQDDFADFLNALSLCDSDITLIGHSAGGALAMQFATVFSQVKQIVLLAPVLGVGPTFFKPSMSDFSSVHLIHLVVNILMHKIGLNWAANAACVSFFNRERGVLELNFNLAMATTPTALKSYREMLSVINAQRLPVFLVEARDDQGLRSVTDLTKGLIDGNHCMVVDGGHFELLWRKDVAKRVRDFVLSMSENGKG